MIINRFWGVFRAPDSCLSSLHLAGLVAYLRLPKTQAKLQCITGKVALGCVATSAAHPAPKVNGGQLQPAHCEAVYLGCLDAATAFSRARCGR